MAVHNATSPAASGISSLLDTDLYKLTMQRAILKFFPNVQVAYSLTNRTPHMRLNRSAFDWLQQQVESLANLSVGEDEIDWLRETCPYFTTDYLDFLKALRLTPKKHVELSFRPICSPVSDPTLSSTPGDISVSIRGPWVETILYEVPMLALISEAYFKFVDQDWNYDGQAAKAESKGRRLLESGCVFSEFGTRRRRDYKTHELVMGGLIAATKTSKASSENMKGSFTGTSNVHFAMRFGVPPIGTVAHEWFMGISAITDDPANANLRALDYWTETFGHGVLAIALTDTCGTPNFLKAFQKPAPRSDLSYAEIFTGVRQDSGDPLEYIAMMKEFYEAQSVRQPKTIVFSDSLNIQKSLEYKAATEAAGLKASFGIGTFFTNDYTRVGDGAKSLPLNIVIKLSEADGRKAVKLSDNKGKNTGDDDVVRRVKALVDYHEREWKQGDETRRWDQ